MAVSNSGMTLYEDNNTQASWAGSDDYDIEVSKDGGGSESWLVSKNGNETATLSKAVNLGTPKYMNFWMKSDWGSFYTEIIARLLDGTNTNSFSVATGGKNTTPNLEPEISGDFKPSVLQISEGSAGGTYVPANHTQFEINVDASSTGNIRSIVNHWIDGIWYGNGRTISGTPATTNIFQESHDLDTSNADYDGCSVSTDAGLVYYTDVTDATASTSSSSAVVFNAKSTTDGTLTLNVSGASTYSGMSFTTKGTTNLNFIPTDLGFSMSGGQISASGNCTLLAGQTYDGVVFNDRTSQNIAATMTDCAWNLCGLIILTGSITGGSLKNATGAVAIQTADLSKLASKPSFESDGSNHAVELTSIGSGNMPWDVTTVGYDEGVTGSPVTPTNTGNEDIYVSATSGTININVASGATTPSIRSAGAVVNVIAGQVTLTLTGLIDGIEVRIRQGSHTLQHTQDVAGGEVGYTYTYVANKKVTISFSGAGIIQSKIISLVLPAVNQSTLVTFENDPSYK